MASPTLSPPNEGNPVQLIGGAAILVIALYMTAGLISNIASNKIGLVFGYAVDMGTFLYPLSFTLRDLIHKAIGKRAAQAVVLSTAVANLLMAAYLGWTAGIPSDPSWKLGAEYAAILSPAWRIVIASIAAATVAELVDTEIFQRIYSRLHARFGRRRQWLAVLASNAVSVPIDNLIFCAVAFAIDLPIEVIFQIFVFNLVVKFGVTLLSIPSIYLIPEGGRIHRAVAGIAKAGKQ